MVELHVDRKLFHPTLDVYTHYLVKVVNKTAVENVAFYFEYEASFVVQHSDGIQ